jgi:phosphinothricin acetyltransferase
MIRPATPDDAAGVLAIYAPIVRHTHISFELEVPTPEEIARRITSAIVWLVAIEDGTVAGYAYATRWRERPAYRFTVEVSVYVHEAHHRRGLAEALYTRLFEELRDYHVAVAAIGLPNPASIAFHERLGFRPVGVFHEVGFKFGQWWGVGWWERRIHPAASPAG